MTGDESLIRRVHAAIEGEPRINMHSFPLHMEMRDSTLILEGEVPNLAAKRLAVRQARRLAGTDKVLDLLQVALTEEKSDGEILDTLSHFLLRQIDLKNCTLRRRSGQKIEVLHEAMDDDRSGDIEFSANDGVVILEGEVISLSHKRIAEVLAWWVPGCRNVLNHLAVQPDEQDGDDEITDAVHLALEMDPAIHAHADQIRVITNHGAVILQGAIAREEEKQLAGFDAWCVDGVEEVDNRLEVVK